MTATLVDSPSIMANVAAGCVGQILQVHTAAGQFAGVLDALVGGAILRLRSGTNVYDVDVAQVVAIAHRVPDPGTVAAPALTYSSFTQAEGHRFLFGDDGGPGMGGQAG